MKTNENKDLKEKNIKKIKKSVSIITVFLWIFLVATMITIMTGNIKNTNAIEDENGSVVEKSAFENAQNLGGGETCYGTIKLNGEAIEDKGVINVLTAGMWSGPVDAFKYKILEITNSDSNVATVLSPEKNSYVDDKELAIVFEPGNIQGTVEISIGLEVYYIHEQLGTFTMEIDLDYTVTNETVYEEANEECVLTYDANGGMNPPESEIQKKGEIFTISDIIPKKKGYLFLGWSTSLTYNGSDKTIYSPKSSIVITGDTILYAVWLEAPVHMGTVKCVNGNHALGRFNLYNDSVLAGFTLGNIYYSEEKKLYLCDMNISGQYFCDKYTILKKSTHYLCQYENNIAKVITLYYDEDLNSWLLLNESDVPVVFYCTCDLNSTDIYGTYKVNHEYYKRDKDNNLILEDTVTTGIIDNVLLGKKVGISNKNESMDVELEKILEHTINGKKYAYEYFENSGSIIIEYDKLQEITLRYVREEGKDKILIKVEKIWEDNNNEYGKRAESVILQIKDKDKVVEEMLVGEKNNWSYEFLLPKYNEEGKEIEYTVDERETSKYYEKVIDGYRVINKYIGEEKNESDNKIIKNEENVNTSDINVWMYVGIAMISIVVIVVVIILVKKNRKKNRKKNK